MSKVLKSAQGSRSASKNQRSITSDVLAQSSAGLQTPTCGSLVGGRYRLIRLLGRGAMGSVYQAEDQFERHCCAVKMLNNAASCSAEELRRFHTEATAISRLSHPNIVQVYDFLKDPSGRSYLVMEYLDGVDLFTHLQAEGRLTLSRTQEIISPVAEALYSAHRLGIIHRDIKPRNIFLSQRPGVHGPNEVVKVVDFGLAKVQSPLHQQTAQGIILGTPEYLSPEATLGRSDEVDARSDQWALAVTAYRLLSGCLPYEHEDVIQLLLRIRMQPPRSLRELVPDLPQHAEQAIARALSRRKEDRFQDIRAFAEALGAPGSSALRTREPISSSSKIRADSSRSVKPSPADEPTRPIPEALLHTLLAQAGNSPARPSAAMAASKPQPTNYQPSWLHKACILLLAPLSLLSGAPDTLFQEQQSLAAKSVRMEPMTTPARSLHAAEPAPLMTPPMKKKERPPTSAPLMPPTLSQAPNQREPTLQRSRRLAPRVHSGARAAATVSSARPSDATLSPSSPVGEVKRSAPILRVQLVDDEDTSPREAKPLAGERVQDAAATNKLADPRISQVVAPTLSQNPPGSSFRRIAGRDPRLPPPPTLGVRS